MRLLLANAYVVAMDDEGTEHDGGWVLVEDGLVAAVGSGAPPEADERQTLTRAQAGRPLHVAARAVPPLGWDRRRCRVRRRPHRPLGGADPVAGLVLSGPHRVDRLDVGGEEVVRDGRLARADEEEIAREHRLQARRFTT